MKLYSKAIPSLILCSLLTRPSFSQTIVMSGNLSSKEKTIVENVTKKLIGPSQLVLWESNNNECHKRTGHLLQICWQGLDLRIVYQKRVMLKNSLGRLIEMNKTQKAFMKKASL